MESKQITCSKLVYVFILKAVLLSIMSKLCHLCGFRLVAETRGTMVFASMAQRPHSAYATHYPSGAFSSADLQPQMHPAAGDDAYQQEQQQQKNNLILTVISPDPYPWSPGLTETFTTSISVTNPWSIVLIPDDCSQAFATAELSAASFNRRGIELPATRDVNNDE